MQKEETGIYYNFIMGDSDTSVKTMFHTKWLNFLDNLHSSYGSALQLRIGNHLRPLLVYWGSALGSKSKADIPIEDLTELAICVEILHKTSIIIDDLIDKDTMRHNKVAFHKQYTPEETIIFAVYMLGTLMTKINCLNSQYNYVKTPFLKLFSQSLREMSIGCLSELKLNHENCYNYETVVSIIQKETATLIKNSLLIGFLSNALCDQKVISLIEQIGEKVGYFFQVMNDLEPFCSNKNLTRHKGALNFDFNRARKNIVLPYIYGCCSIREKNLLTENVNPDQELILHLYTKYKIESVIKSDMIAIQAQIQAHLDALDKYPINHICLMDFKHFYNDISQIANDRLLDESKKSTID